MNWNSSCRQSLRQYIVAIAMATSSWLLPQPACSNDNKTTTDHIPADLIARIEALLEINSAPHRIEASRMLFASLTRPELQRLLTHDHPDVSIRSATELVYRDKGSTESIDLFLNTIRLVLAVEPPSWWTSAVRNGTVKHVPLRHTKLDPKFFPKYVQRADGWFVQRHQTVRKVQSEFHLVEGKHSVPIPGAAMFQREKSGWGGGHGLDGTFTAENCYVTTHGGNSANFPFYRIDRRTGDVVWEAVIVGRGMVTSLAGLASPERMEGQNAVSILCDVERVIVFGANPIEAHVEVFRASDGKVRSRCCTTYSY